jgi:choline transport protein
MPQRWHTILIMWVLIVVPFIFNLLFWKVLNAFKLIGGICYFLFFIIAIAILTVLVERSTPQFVF